MIATDEATTKIADTDMLAYFQILRQLKETKRTGWLNKGIMECESIADHMYRMAMIMMVIELPEGLDRSKCVMMVHDLAAAIVGDITPDCGVSQEEKRRRETEAIGVITTPLGARGKHMRDLWFDYDTCGSAEAKFVKQLDKFEFGLQTSEYERSKGLRMDDFFGCVKTKLSDPNLQRLYDQIDKKRDDNQ
jgi:putative hydrolase of HD superfamily